MEKKIDLKKLQLMSHNELIMIIAGIEGMTYMDVEDTVKTSVTIPKDKISYQLYVEGFIQGGENFLLSMRESIHDIIREGFTK